MTPTLTLGKFGRRSLATGARTRVCKPRVAAGGLGKCVATRRIACPTHPVHTLPMSLKDRLVTLILEILCEANYYPFITRISGDDLVFMNLRGRIRRDGPARWSGPTSPTGSTSSSTTARRTQAGISRAHGCLEVSCGHGGASLVPQCATLGPASYTGLDLQPSRRRRRAENGTNLPGLISCRANAENLPSRRTSVLRTR